MKSYEFYRQYANTPLSERSVDLGGATLNDIYCDLKMLEDKIRPDVIQIEHLLSMVEQSNLFGKKTPPTER